MSYQEKFSASQQKAHNRIIATKIHQEMSKLRAEVETSPTSPRRWVWELIQNAKDVSIGGKVRVAINADLEEPDAHVTFRHDGGAFTAENIRFLIEQVSSKDRTLDSEGRPTKTGRFGTGFLTTHLLSEKVQVNGVVKEVGLAPRKFELLLDRSGDELEEIILAVGAAMDSMQGLDNQQPYELYEDGEFNTSFRYDLDDETGRNVAKAGLNDLELCLPYTLMFVQEIESVAYSGHLVSRSKTDQNTADGQVGLHSVTTRSSNGVCTDDYFAVLSDGLTTIALPVEPKNDGVIILPLKSQLPRLFCDFPLIGTEDFPFQVIINNPSFIPTEPRDGVFLTKSDRFQVHSNHNRTIIKQALALVFRLLDWASENEWQNLHLLAVAKPVPSFNWADRDWYKTDVLQPMKMELLKAKIVRTASNNLLPIVSADGNHHIWFPSSPNKDIRHRIWLCFSSWFPNNLPAESDVDFWYQTIWSECKKLTLQQIAEFIEQSGSIEKISLVDQRSVFDWLNAFYETLRASETDFQEVVGKRRIFPNQNGIFRRKVDLSRDAGDIDIQLLNILKLFGNDLRDSFLATEICTNLDDLASKDSSFVVTQIAASINKLINDRNALDQYRPAVSTLLLWFHENPSRARALFPILYEQKHRLYDDEEIVSNIRDSEQLKELLKQFNVKSVAELRTVIEGKSGADAILPVTQQIIASLGITSVDEWKKALEDRNLKELFSHESTPTEDMFVFAQSLIENAKRRIIEHLSKIAEYDLTDLDETAVTVLAGIRKEGREVTIVVRPAYDDTVIIYYQSERDVLDFVDHELWVDTGKCVRRITFGHILKKTQIRRFPI